MNKNVREKYSTPNTDKLKKFLKKKTAPGNFSKKEPIEKVQKLLHRTEAIEIKKEKKIEKKEEKNLDLENFLDKNNQKKDEKEKAKIEQKKSEKEKQNILDIKNIESLQQKKSLVKNNKNNEKSNFKKKLEKILDHPLFILFMMIITIIILFISDIQIIWIDPSWDFALDILKLVIFIIYILEILVSSIALNDYIYSFFFWLDLLSTIYILQDINFILNPLLGINSENIVNFQQNLDINDEIDNNLKFISNVKIAFAKITQASRATRILRILRIVRFIRMVKIYKAGMAARHNFEKIKLQTKNIFGLNKEKENEKKELIENIISESNSFSSNLNNNNNNERNSLYDSYKVKDKNSENILREQLDQIEAANANNKLYSDDKNNNNADNNTNKIISEFINIEPKKKKSNFNLKNIINGNYSYNNTNNSNKPLNLNSLAKNDFNNINEVNYIYEEIKDFKDNENLGHNRLISEEINLNTENNFENDDINTDNNSNKISRVHFETSINEKHLSIKASNFPKSKFHTENKNLNIKNKSISSNNNDNNDNSDIINEINEINIPQKIKKIKIFSGNRSNINNNKIINQSSKNLKTSIDIDNKFQIVEMQLESKSNKQISNTFLSKNIKDINTFKQQENQYLEDNNININTEEAKMENNLNRLESENINFISNSINDNNNNLKFEDNLKCLANNSNSHSSNSNSNFNKSKSISILRSKEASSFKSLINNENVNWIKKINENEEDNNNNENNNLCSEKNIVPIKKFSTALLNKQIAFSEKNVKNFFDENNNNNNDNNNNTKNRKIPLFLQKFKNKKNIQNFQFQNQLSNKFPKAFSDINEIYTKKTPNKNPDKTLKELLAESKTRIFITESITRKVVLIILTLIIILPILAEEIYSNENLDQYYILTKYISNFQKIIFKENLVENKILNYIESDNLEDYPIINISDFEGNYLYSNKTLMNKNFRLSDIGTASSDDGNILIAYSINRENILMAELAIIKTIFICFILLISSLSFEKDTKKIVLDPLEYILEIVNLISKDPDKAKEINNLRDFIDNERNFLKTNFYKSKNNEINNDLNANNNEINLKEINSENNKSKISKLEKNKNNKNNLKRSRSKEENFNEIEKVENAIKKIFGLLAVCLGEAGNELIKKNLSENKNLDALVKGSKIKAIFGFCDIRDFSILNECLQEETILLLNEVADIVHSSVDLFFGAINKNIGDSFLSVWKNNNNKNMTISNKNLNLNFRESKLSPGKNAENKEKKNEMKLPNIYNDNSPIKKLLQSKGNQMNEKNEQKEKTDMKKILNDEINYFNNNNNNNNEGNIINIEKITKNQKEKDDKKSIVQLKENNKILNPVEKKFKLNSDNNLLNTIKEGNKINNTNKEIPNNNNIADCAILSFINILIQINKSAKILSYQLNQKIQKKIPEFKLNMGFGLHLGWAIEGAIGSNYKIDASYLSPNVNMAARLQGATKQYGVSILFSGQIFEILSKEIKQISRLIDIVTVKGSIDPLRLYTIDVNLNLRPSRRNKKDYTQREKLEKQKILKDEIKNKNDLTKLMLEKKVFKKILKNGRNKKFYKNFELGFDSYIEGNWKEAKVYFLQAMKMFRNDGPVINLYDFIESYDFCAPNDWRGYRALTSK